MTNIHAHVSISTADCDGEINRSHTEVYSEDELREQHEANGVNDFSDIHFMERVLLSVASPYTTNVVNITMDEHGIEVREDTEEGYRNATVQWCEYDCTTDTTTYQDVRAEQMGY